MGQKVVAIVQARLGSSRLPLKSLLCLKGKPLINWVLERLSSSHLLDEIIVAIPDTPLDKALAAHLQSMGANFLQGPEQDVLGRYVLAAEAVGADLVVRVCADNPLVSGEAIDKLIEFYAQADVDYAWNHVPRNNLWPDGLGGEILSARLLRRLALDADLPAQREHCLNYIWDNASKFTMSTFNPEQAWLCHPEIKLDIDTAEDFCRLSLFPLDPRQDLSTLMEIMTAGEPEGGLGRQ